MKIIIILYALFAVSSATSAKYSWEKISYYHTTGPVSPEYQYSYIITIGTDGQGKIEYTKSGKTNVYEFTVGKKGLNSLNTALMKSKVMTTSTEEIGSNTNLIGGPLNSATITLPFPENEKEKEKKPVILVPNKLNENFSAGILNMFYVMENLVPASIWKQAME